MQRVSRRILELNSYYVGEQPVPAAFLPAAGSPLEENMSATLVNHSWKKIPNTLSQLETKVYTIVAEFQSESGGLLWDNESVIFSLHSLLAVLSTEY